MAPPENCRRSYLSPKRGEDMSGIRKAWARRQQQLTIRPLFFSKIGSKLNRRFRWSVFRPMTDMKLFRPIVPTLLVLLLLSTPFATTIKPQELRKSSLVSKERVQPATVGIRIEPPDEAFSIWMPEAPKVGVEPLILEREPALLKYYGLSQNGSEYAVLSLTGLDTSKPDLAHILMLDLYRRFIPTSMLDDAERSGAALKASFVRELQLNGHKGREYSLKAGGRAGQWYLFTVGARFYAVGATTTGQDASLVQRFLESLSFGKTDQAAVVTAPKEEPVKDVAPQQPAPAAAAPTGTWFVIVQTLGRTDRARAQERSQSLRNHGFEAQVVETDKYPKLRNGFLAVVLGPYSRPEAQNVLRRVRSVAPDAYLKSGW